MSGRIIRSRASGSAASPTTPRTTSATSALEFANYIVEQPKFVHNSYLEMLAETGLIGLGLFVAVILGSLGCAWRAGRLFDATGDHAMATLSRAAIVSVLAMLAAAYFISGTTDRRLWVLLALGPALLASTASARPRRRTPSR